MQRVFNKYITLNITSVKKIYLLVIASTLSLLTVKSQNLAVNTDGSLANPNAILDIKSGNKGILIPRMDATARMSIPNTKGLLVYDTTSNSFWYNTGTTWLSIATTTLAAGDAWLLNGNSGTTDGVNFLGTTDNVPLSIRVNNQWIICFRWSGTDAEDVEIADYH